MDVVTVARSQQDGFDIALRRRTDGQRVIDELIVNGAFAMDSEQTFSEQLLAEVLGPTPGAALVAGLGLGYTTSRLLELGATTVDVVEISSALIGWAYEGLTEVLGQIAHDPRVRLHRGDIADVLCAPPTLPGFFGPWDAIALDVDNGPDFLIVAQNERVYHPAPVAGWRSGRKARTDSSGLTSPSSARKPPSGWSRCVVATASLTMPSMW